VVTVMARQDHRRAPAWWVARTGGAQSDLVYFARGNALVAGTFVLFYGVRFAAWVTGSRPPSHARWVSYMCWSRPGDARELLMYLYEQGDLRQLTRRNVVVGLQHAVGRDRLSQLALWRGQREVMADSHVFDARVRGIAAALGIAAGVAGVWWVRGRRGVTAEPCMLRELPSVVAENPSGWQRANAQDAVGDPRVPGHEHGRVPEAVPRFVFKDPVAIQSATTPEPDVVNTLRANTCLFEFCDPDHVGAATCLGGPLYVTAAHNFVVWLSAGKRGALVPIGPLNGFLTVMQSKYAVDESQVYLVPGRDVAFFTITARPGKSLEKIALTTLAGLEQVTWLADGIFMERTGETTRTLAVRRAPSVGVARARSVYIREQNVVVDPESPLVLLSGAVMRGTSGAGVVLSTGKNRVLAGVVTATGGGHVIITPFSAEDVAEAKKHLWLTRAQVVSAPTFGAACRDPLSSVCHRNSWVNYAEGVSFAGDLLGYSPKRERARMSLAPTAFFEVLRPFLDRFGAHFAAPAVGTSPVCVNGEVQYRSTHLTVARAFCPRSPPPAQLVRAAVEEYFGAYPDPPDWVRPLTLEEAVFGVPGMYDRVEPSTSSGQWGGTKRAWIDFERREISPDLRVAVERFIAGLPEVEVEALFFAYKHKDEGRSLKRVVEFRTRFFNVGDLHVFLAMRMLFLPWLRWMRTLSVEITECAVGVNAVSKAWEHLHRPLDEFSTDKICGDFTDYDKVSDPIFNMGISIGVQSVLERGTGYDLTARRALGVLIVLCAYPVTKIDEVVLIIYGSSPSGVNGTTELNSMRGALTFRVAYLILVVVWEPDPDLGPGWFRRWVRAIWYGDDNKAASRRKWFNQVTLQETLKSWGDKYTDANKSGVLREFTPQEEETFLKRRVLVWHDMWLAPLELKSVFRCGAYAVESTAGAMARDQQAIPNMMAELWLHRDQPELYEEVRGALLAAMPMKYEGGELVITIPTALEQERRYIDGSFSTWDGGSPEWVTAVGPARDAAKLDLRVNERSDIEDKTNAPSTAQTLNARMTSGAAYYRGDSESFLGPGVRPHLPKSVAKVGGQRQTMNNNQHMSGAAIAPLGTAPMEGTNTATSEAQLITNSADASNTVGAHEAPATNDTGLIMTEVGVQASVMPPAAPPPLADSSVLANWWERQVPILTTAWSSVSGPSFVDVWSAYFTNFAVVRKAANFARVKCGLRLTILVGGTGFHYGKITFRYLPRHFDQITALSRMTSTYDAVQVTSLAGVDVDVSGAATVQLDLPYAAPNEWIDLSNSGAAFIDTIDAMGVLVIKPLTTLRHVTLATPPNVPITVYACLTNATFASPVITTYATVTSGKEASPAGVYSRPLSTLAAGATAVASAIPAAAPYALPLSAMATAASRVAAAFGYSKPVVPGAVTPVVSAPWASTGTASGNDWVAPAGLDPVGVLPPGGAIAGFGADEMSHAFFASREALINPNVDGFLWNTTDTAGTRVVSIPVTPQVCVRSSATTVRFTPLGSLCVPYANWRGTLRFRIRANASKFHQGRLLIYYVPSGSTANAGGFPPTMLKSVVLDLSERTEVELSVGFQATQPYLWLPPSLARAQCGFLECIAGGTGAAINDTFLNGMIVIQVESPLTAPLTTNHVPILVSLSAGDDFEVVHHTVRQLTTAALTSGYAYDRNAPDELAPALTSPPSSAITTERYNHLRPLLARYQLKMDLNLGRPLSIDIAQNRVVIPARGWKSIGAGLTPNVNYMAPTIASWFAASESAVIQYVPTTPLDYFRSMFAGERGGIKWRAHHFDYGATVASRINAAVSPWCDQEGNGGTTLTDFNGAIAVTSTAQGSFLNTDAYQWGGDTEASPVGVSVPYAFSRYYLRGVDLPRLAQVSSGETTFTGFVGFDVYRRCINSANTERNITGPFVTNKFTLLMAAGDDFSLVGFQYPPLLTTA